MKKTALLTAMFLSISCMAGCNFSPERIDEVREEAREQARIAASEAAAEAHGFGSYSSTEPAPGKAEFKFCTVDDVTFEVPAEWEALEELDGSFYAEDRKAIFQLQGASVLGSYEPLDFYNSLVKMYSEEGFEVLEQVSKLEELTLRDESLAYLGKIKMFHEGGTYFYVNVLIVPQKNTVLTYAAQRADQNNLTFVYLHNMASSTAIHIGEEDMLSGRDFRTNMDICISLDEDGSFDYFQDPTPENKHDITTYVDGFSGVYEVYRGKEAQDKLVSMTEYGLTREELEQTLKASMNGYKVGGVMPSDYTFDDDGNLTGYDIDDDSEHVCLDNFYALILDVERKTEGGVPSDSEGEALYFGYYIEDEEMFDLVSANTASYTQWEEE